MSLKFRSTYRKEQYFDEIKLSNQNTDFMQKKKNKKPKKNCDFGQILLNTNLV